jgi:hypothetical protein
MFNFLTGLALQRHQCRVRKRPWTMFFNGVRPPKIRRPLPWPLQCSRSGSFYLMSKVNAFERFLRNTRSGYWILML